MLDTVKHLTVRPLHPQVWTALLAGNLQPVDGWHFDLHSRPHGAGSSIKTVFCGNYKPAGLYVESIDGQIRWYSASLPRALHGFNGVQLKSDGEIDAAAERVRTMIDLIAERSILRERYARLDVALNLEYAEPERLVQALRYCRHPWISRETERYHFGAIRLPGTEVVFQAYWKRPPQRSPMRQKAWHTPGVLRLEVQLKKRGKIEDFLDDLPDDLPTMAQLYRGFRNFMLKFPKSSQLLTKCEMASLLALCAANQVRLPGGQDVLEWHRQSVGRSGHSKMRRKVASATCEFVDIDWAELLPSDFIPASVDVYADGLVRQVPPIPLAAMTHSPL